jgi:multisubunit Na+/H+ antiporter MnhB subunit
MTEIHLILFFMIAAAVVAVEVKDLLSSVVAIGAVGIGLCMAFLALKAPDLAIMQLVVEILSLIILVRATIRKDLPFSTSGRWFFNTLSTIAFVTVFLAAGYMALIKMPRFGAPLMKVSKFYLDQTALKGAGRNTIETIALDYRVLDTLGETTIVFAAIIGILAVARKVGLSGEAKDGK